MPAQPPAIGIARPTTPASMPVPYPVRPTDHAIRLKDTAGVGDRRDSGLRWLVRTRTLPLPWEERASVRLRRSALRLPAPGDPAPAAARMLGVCAWAALLAMAGLLTGGRALLAMLFGTTPYWYDLIVVGGGVAGIGLTAAAFLAVHHPRLPWALLTVATAPLLIIVATTVTAT